MDEFIKRYNLIIKNSISNKDFGHKEKKQYEKDKENHPEKFSLFLLATLPILKTLKDSKEEYIYELKQSYIMYPEAFDDALKMGSEFEKNLDNKMFYMRKR